MPITVPTVAPLTVRYMQRVEWTRTFSDYASANGWTVSVAMTGPSKGDGFQDAGADAGAGAWTFAFETSDREIGRYAWQVWAVHSTDGRRLLESGAMEILAGYLEGATDRDSSTHNSRMLALLEARLEDRLALDAEQYSVSGRSLSRIPIAEVEQMRNRYARRVRVENREREAGVRSGVRRKILAGF